MSNLTANPPGKIQSRRRILLRYGWFTIEDSIDLKKWFSELDQKTRPSESQQTEVHQIYAQVCDIIRNLLPGGTTKIVPLGSYLLGCQRKEKLEVDCILLDRKLSTHKLEVNPALEINLMKIKELFQERKATFQLVNNYYQLYEVVIELTKADCQETENSKLLFFTHSLTGIKIKLINLEKKENFQSGSSEKKLSLFSSTLYHVWWLDQQYSREPVSQEVSKLMRLIRLWKSINNLNFPSEIIDLAIVYSTYNFKELDTVKVLLKFFALINLLLNDYHYYFYELSEQHSYLIKVNF